MAIANSCYETAERFLRPVLSKDSSRWNGGRSLVEALSSDIVSSDAEEYVKVKQVVDKALCLLEDIDQVTANSKSENEVLLDNHQKRLVDALLDLILLEGIHPYLSPGVGIPIEQRVRSILQRGFMVSPQKYGASDSSDLVSTVHRLSKLATNGSKLLMSEVLDRSLGDLIAVMAQLTFGRRDRATKGNSSIANFNAFLARISTATLLPCLTSLLHPAAPPWLRSCLAIERSLLPIRSDGVRQTILYMSRSMPATLSGEPSITKGVGFSQDALSQATRLLSSVPSTTSVRQYFAAIAPQLLALLDDSDESVSQAASHIISQGILNRRATGAPGTVGWNFFVRPLFAVIKPTSLPPDHSAPKHPDGPRSLVTALRRLSNILSSTNPGLLKRLVTPLVLPLWAIMNVAVSAAEERTLCSDLLYKCIDVTAGAVDLLKIVDKLCWDGEAGWKYRLSSSRNVITVRRTEEIDTASYIDTMLDVIPSRVKSFFQLLKSSAEDQDVIIVLMHVLRRWLLDNGSSNPFENGSGKSDELLQRYVDAQIAQELIIQQKSRLIAEPLQIIDLCNELLRNYVDSYNMRQAGRQPTKPSMASISNIVEATPTGMSFDEHKEFSDETVSTSVALLANVFNESISETSSSFRATVEELKATISAILRTQGLSRSSRSSASMLLSILEHNFEKNPSLDLGAPKPLDYDVYQNAMGDLGAPEPHIRAQAISSITTLIENRSPIISVPPLVITLLSLVQDPESFVYLPAIRALATLARLDAMPVMKQLMEAYEDRLEESSIDVRLRVGETLQSILEDAGKAQPQAAVQRTSQVVLRMAGRRSIRPKAEKSRKAKQAARDQRRKEVGLATNETNVEVSDSGSEAEELRMQLRTAAILEGWQEKAGEEDVRIRASSLSLLSTIIEQCNLSTMGSTIAQTVEVLHDILTKEPEEEKAILRRAAVLGFNSVLKATDSMETQGIIPGFENERRSLDDIVELLEQLKIRDEDEVVRGHAESALESLEAWRENRLQRIIAREDIRFGLEEKGGLKGIEINVDMVPRESFQKPKIEEVE